LKKLLVLLLAALFVLPLAACGSKNAPQNFYSMVEEPTALVNNAEGTLMLGMKRGDSVTGYVRDDITQKLRYDADNVLVSMTSYNKLVHPLGVTWDMTKDDVIAFYAKDPEVTLADAQANPLVFTKTIDGTVYYARYVFYSDNTIFQTNQTTDPTVDPLSFPK